jgi:hypothetical protein
MTTTRAKFTCQSETKHAWNPAVRGFKFSAAYDPDIPEDQRYAKATPTGNLEITVDNPNVNFEIGKSYYLDITPVDTEN